MKLNLETRLGPFKLRAWGLIINMAANAVALYGLAAVMRGENGYLPLLSGVAASLLCIAVLARPDYGRD